MRYASSVLSAAFLLLLPALAAPQVPDPPADTVPADTLRFRGEPIVVTATRSPRPVFVTPKPVSVVQRSTLRERTLNTVTDLFTELPGVDVTGVGINQVRPVIRGQRGQRILLLSDGLRLNNTRRQQDFGEIPGLVDVGAVDRVEVVRGPSSVLYGTDAIGGVVNIITREPEAEGVSGFGRYAWGSHGQHAGTIRTYGRQGRLDFQLGASVRTADPYDAPSGDFGAIRLEEPARVHDTGIDDGSLDARLGYRLSEDARVFLKHERYTATDAGFGYVASEAYAPDQGLVRIRYPDQSWHRTTAGWEARELNTPVADRVELRAYYQGNERSLEMTIEQAIGPTALLSIESENYTDIRTVGFRAEAARLALPGVLLTYGVDLFQDNSDNTDLSVTTITGFGPQPIVDTDDAPQIPNAWYRSMGGFVQADLEPVDRLELVLGARVQDVRAETDAPPAGATEPASRSDRTVVGSANLSYRLTDAVTLVGTVGRGFRSPNLIELFFQGATPEGSGFQVRNDELEAETSLNVDLGARARYGPVRVEAFVFRNDIENGIRIAPRGDTVDGLPAYWNVNVDELRYEGVELSGDLALPARLTLGSSFTSFRTENLADPESDVGESFSSRLTGSLRWDAPAGRGWAEYRVRHQGEQKDVIIENNPIGETLPSFTVHTVRGGVILARSIRGAVPRLLVSVENLTDELYAEATNSTFFRPQPGRLFTVGLDVAF